jgi:hypothetical protein
MAAKRAESRKTNVYFILCSRKEYYSLGGYLIRRLCYNGVQPEKGAIFISCKKLQKEKKSRTPKQRKQVKYQSNLQGELASLLVK